MSTNPAVRRLDQDLKRMHQDAARMKHAQATVKGDTAKEKSALQQIAAQQQTLIDDFTQAPPQTTADQISMLKQMFALGQKQVQTKDHFDHAIAGDKHQVSKFHHAEKKDHLKALKDLKPAEYHLSLKATNRDRKELGLNPLKKPLRAADPNHVTATMRRLAAAGHSVAMSMGGYVSGGLCATGVSRALRQAMGITVYGNGNQIDNNLPKSKFKQIHIPLAQALKIPGLVLTWEHTSTAAGSIYGHTAITTGDGHSSCSDFIERDTLAGNRSRTGLKIFMPTV